MHALSASELLDVWERGLAQSFVQRALTLLAAARPETEPEELAKLSIGQRDALLLMLREWTFGPSLPCLATCPNCSQLLEFILDIAEIRAVPEAELAQILSLTVSDYVVQFRLPNSEDLAALPAAEDPNTAQPLLLNHCLIAVHQNNQERSTERLPVHVVQAVADKMAKADPQADVQLELSCPSCQYQWQMTFDIVSFFWGEIDAWARRILREVHILASAYGWPEADVLAMSPWRRQLYLEMVGR